jgi:hypothetical protein
MAAMHHFTHAPLIDFQKGRDLMLEKPAFLDQEADVCRHFGGDWGGRFTFHRLPFLSKCDETTLTFPQWNRRFHLLNAKISRGFIAVTDPGALQRFRGLLRYDGFLVNPQGGFSKNNPLEHDC